MIENVPESKVAQANASIPGSLGFTKLQTPAFVIYRYLNSGRCSVAACRNRISHRRRAHSLAKHLCNLFDVPACSAAKEGAPRSQAPGTVSWRDSETHSRTHVTFGHGERADGFFLTEPCTSFRSFRLPLDDHLPARISRKRLVFPRSRRWSVNCRLELTRSLSLHTAGIGYITDDFGGAHRKPPWRPQHPLRCHQTGAGRRPPPRTPPQTSTSRPFGAGTSISS